MPDRFDYLEISDTPSPPVVTADEQPLGATTAWTPTRLKAVETVGCSGTGAGQFAAPLALAVDRDGALYVVDGNNHRVQRIAMNGDVLVYGCAGQMPGQLWGPQAVAVHPGGSFFFVAEQGNNRIQCFHFNGQSRGVMAGFRAPSGLCFDAEGHLWVADTGNGRVVRIDISTGQIIGGMDGSAGILQPISISVDTGNNLYITDASTNDVTRYTFYGVRAHALGEFRRLQDPRQTAVDAGGRIYLAEAGADRIHVFDGAGASLVVCDTPASKLGQFRRPSGVALGPRGEIYVSDTGNNRVVRLAWE